MMPRNDSNHDLTVATPLLTEESTHHHDHHEKLSIDQVLQDWAGEFGRAQFRHFTLVSLAWCLQSLITFTMVFSDATPSWVCTSNSLNMSSALPHLQGHVPEDILPSNAMEAQKESLSCNSSSSICSMDTSLWTWVGGSGKSTVSEWGLVCDNSYKVGLVQSLFFTGALVGAGVYGGLSDSFLGRKGVLIITCTLGSLFSLFTAFTPNYWVYIVLRMATGFNVGGMGTAAFVLAMETVGPSKRGTASMSIFFFYSLGIIFLSTLAFFTPSWRHLCVLSSTPCVLYCLILPFLCESPRWYLARGRVHEALAILKQIALRNGKTIPPTIILETEEDESQLQEPKAKATALDIFRLPSTRMQIMIMLVIWLSNGLLYYGINLDVPNVVGNISLGLILNAIGEMPAYVITAIMLQRYGRRPVLVCVMMVSGMSCLVGAFIGGSKVRLGCGVVAIFGVAASYNLAFIYTAELFPTEVRNAAMGLTAQAAQVGAVAAPLTAVMGSIHAWLPFSVFSAIALLGSCLACWLPETLEKPMYETLQGMLA